MRQIDVCVDVSVRIRFRADERATVTEAVAEALRAEPSAWSVVSMEGAPSSYELAEVLVDGEPVEGPTIRRLRERWDAGLDDESEET